jgi:hypothetical protein
MEHAQNKGEDEGVYALYMTESKTRGFVIWYLKRISGMARS